MHKNKGEILMAIKYTESAARKLVKKLNIFTMTDDEFKNAVIIFNDYPHLFECYLEKYGEFDIKDFAKKAYLITEYAQERYKNDLEYFKSLLKVNPRITLYCDPAFLEDPKVWTIIFKMKNVYTYKRDSQFNFSFVDAFKRIDEEKYNDINFIKNFIDKMYKERIKFKRSYYPDDLSIERYLDDRWVKNREIQKYIILSGYQTIDEYLPFDDTLTNDSEFADYFIGLYNNKEMTYDELKAFKNLSKVSDFIYNDINDFSESLEQYNIKYGDKNKNGDYDKLKQFCQCFSEKDKLSDMYKSLLSLLRYSTECEVYKFLMILEKNNENLCNEFVMFYGLDVHPFSYMFLPTFHDKIVHRDDSPSYYLSTNTFDFIEQYSYLYKNKLRFLIFDIINENYPFNIIKVGISDYFTRVERTYKSDTTLSEKYFTKYFEPNNLYNDRNIPDEDLPLFRTVKDINNPIPHVEKENSHHSKNYLYLDMYQYTIQNSGEQFIEYLVNNLSNKLVRYSTSIIDFINFVLPDDYKTDENKILFVLSHIKEQNELVLEYFKIISESQKLNIDLVKRFMEENVLVYNWCRHSVKNNDEIFAIYDSYVQEEEKIKQRKKEEEELERALFYKEREERLKRNQDDSQKRLIEQIQEFIIKNKLDEDSLYIGNDKGITNGKQLFTYYAYSIYNDQSINTNLYKTELLLSNDFTSCLLKAKNKKKIVEAIISDHLYSSKLNCNINDENIMDLLKKKIMYFNIDLENLNSYEWILVLQNIKGSNDLKKYNYEEVDIQKTLIPFIMENPSEVEIFKMYLDLYKPTIGLFYSYKELIKYDDYVKISFEYYAKNQDQFEEFCKFFTSPIESEEVVECYINSLNKLPKKAIIKKLIPVKDRNMFNQYYKPVIDRLLKENRISKKVITECMTAMVMAGRKNK